MKDGQARSTWINHYETLARYGYFSACQQSPPHGQGGQKSRVVLMVQDVELGDLFQTQDFAGKQVGKDAFADFFKLQNHCTQIRGDSGAARRLLNVQTKTIMEHSTHESDPYAFMLAFLASLANTGDERAETYLQVLRRQIRRNAGWVEGNFFHERNSNKISGKSFTLFGSHLLRGENHYLPYLYDAGKRAKLDELFQNILVGLAGTDAFRISRAEKLRFSSVIFEAFTNCLIHAGQTKSLDREVAFERERANFWALSFRRIVVDQRQDSRLQSEANKRRFKWIPELGRYVSELGKRRVKFLIFASVFDDGPGIVDHFCSSSNIAVPTSKDGYVQVLSKLFTTKLSSLETAGAGKGCKSIFENVVLRDGQVLLCTGPTIATGTRDSKTPFRLSAASDDAVREKLIGTNYLFVIPIFHE